LSVRISVLGSGSRGNSTLVATERTRLLLDAGFSKKETCARLASVGETADGLDAIVISHEHTDHIQGLRSVALSLRVPIYVSRATREAIRWDPRLEAFEHFRAGEKFAIGNIEITPFTVPHDAADPVAFTLEAEGVKIGVVTDLGYIPEVVKQHVRGCQCLIFESNHDLEMLRLGPYPWYVKQRVMSRHGHLSNHATSEFLSSDYDGAAAVLVLAHLSENNNHPELARLSAEEALARHNGAARPELHLASKSLPSPVFRF
jgi:phosphoribosyl 1,2-cyclic phosphodiesterase